MKLALSVVFLSLTSSLVFALPADAGEKMGLSITVLLAYAVYLTLITDAMPNTSMQVSLVAVYLMMLLGLCAVNVVLTVFILRLHHRSDSNPINRRFGRLILKLRRLLRFRDRESQAAGLDTISEDLKPESKRTERHRPPHLITNAFETTNRHGSVDLGKYNGKSATRKRSIARGRSVHSLNNATEAERCADNNEAVSGKVVAETLDFLLFVVCTVLSLGTTFLCLLTLVAGSATNALDTTLN